MDTLEQAIDLPRSLASQRVGMARLAIGVLQGIALYFLYRAGRDHSWPASVPLLFAPLLLAALFPPLILIASLGHMSRRQVLAWVGTAAVLVAALGVYDIWRVVDLPVFIGPGAAADPAALTRAPSHVLIFVLVAGLFIAHSLIVAGVQEGRRIASYPRYFETAWKLGVQHAFSAFFVGVVWLVLMLGAQLFLLIKLDFLDELTRKSWFVIPVITFAFACGVHLTDVRPAIVRGVRALLLTLMAWVLPVITLLVGGFILSLPFTGLAPLWATKHAASVLLLAAAAFVVLINAAYQDGAAVALLARVIRASARAACALLVPITAIAVYALALRVGDYGWTADRVIAAACLLVASCYAVGYAAAALRPGAMHTISGVNVGTAFLVLAMLVALCSPVADPARLSVNDQLARLTSGRIPAAKFDFSYLRFEGQRYGREALARLEAGAAGKDPEVRERIAAARKMTSRWDRQGEPVLAAPDLAANMTVWPKWARLPDTFLSTKWQLVDWHPGKPECLLRPGVTCDAYMLDLSDDGKPEILVVGSAKGTGAALFGEDERGQWKTIGSLPFTLAGCESLRRSLIAGSVHAVKPQVQDIEVAGQRVHVSPAGAKYKCEEKK